MARDPNAQWPPLPNEPPGGMTAPTVTGINPTSGAVGGGVTVTVTGTGFTGATSVLFGSVLGTNLTVVSDTQLTVTSPAQAGGTVDVTVTAPAGTSATSAADQFTYGVAEGKTPKQPRTSGTR